MGNSRTDGKYGQKGIILRFSNKFSKKVAFKIILKITIRKNKNFCWKWLLINNIIQYNENFNVVDQTVYREKIVC